MAKSVSINGDSLEYDKRGRLLKDHQYEAAARARVAQLLGQAPIILRGRSQKPTTSGLATSRARLSKPPSRETVFKIIQWTKAANTPARQARYVGRVRAADEEKGLSPIPMENEVGQQIVGREAIDYEIESWGLIPDRDNKSKAAKEAAPQQLASMKSGDRLAKRQAVHIIFSVPARSTTDADKLRAAVRAGLAETFGDAGHRYLFGIHTEHSDTPHAHIIVKAAKERFLLDRRRSANLRLGPAELQTIRYILTSHARQQGIDVIATRREDRAETRSAILEGQEPLRADHSWHQSKKTQQGRTFEKAAPKWYRAHGTAYERRRADMATGTSSMLRDSPGRSTEAAEAPKQKQGLLDRLFGRAEKHTIPQPDLLPTHAKGYYQNFANVRAGQAAKAAAIKNEDPAIAQLTAAFQRSHHDPVATRSSFLEMYREAPKIAVWAAHNHPEAFGSITGIKPDAISTVLLKQLPESDRPKAEAWSKDQELAQRHEIRDLKRARDQAKANIAGNKNLQSILRSMELAAANAETAIKHDPSEAKETAAQIRQLAAELTPRVEPAGPANVPQSSIVADQYRELEEQLRQQHRDIGKRRERELE
jgi:hypothetical protein